VSSTPSVLGVGEDGKSSNPHPHDRTYRVSLRKPSWSIPILTKHQTYEHFPKATKVFRTYLSPVIMFFQKNTAKANVLTAQDIYQHVANGSQDKIITIQCVTKQNGTCSKSLEPTSFLVKLSRSLSTKKAKKARQDKLLAQLEYLEKWYNEAPCVSTTITASLNAFDTYNPSNNDDMIAGRNNKNKDAKYTPWDTQLVDTLSYDYHPSMSQQLPRTMHARTKPQQPCEQYRNIGIMI
jgi:hypothetical protein